MIQYRAVESLYPNSVYAPKSAYARLWISAYDHKDTLGTLRLTDSIADRYRGTRYAESALYLWKQWSRRNDERTALLDSLLANPDTSGAARFVEEADSLSTPAPDLVPAATSSPDSGHQVPAAVMEKLRAAAKAERRASRGTEETAERRQVRARAGPRGHDALHGSARRPRPARYDPERRPADTTRSAAPPDTTRSPAPADTTRGTAPPDTSGTSP